MNKRDAWGSLADDVIIVGLTGGIASGKSEFASELKKLGGFIIDADEIAGRITLPGGAAFEEVVSHFGSNIIAENGLIDRKALSDIVFKDVRAKEKLEHITHPIVLDEIASELKTFRENMGEGPPVVIVDVPLLVETGLAGAFDAVIVVDACEDLRIRRLVEYKGFNECEARERMACQADDYTRLTCADIVVENNADKSSLKEKARYVWERISAIAPGTA
ncbi:MAG: dephospho-CoA kinase [Actinobacteria bacterium]|nr:dephospho-CoA kinase [Actinomycetota bacterium]